MQGIEAWLFALVLAVGPHDTHRVPYAELAADVAYTVERNGALPGAGKAQTAAIMLAVAFAESGWRADVDDGRTRGRAGECGLWQTMPAGPEGCPGTRRAAAALALARMRRSFVACASNPLRDRLAAYASGRCTAGLVESRVRMDLAERWFKRHPYHAQNVDRRD